MQYIIIFLLVLTLYSPALADTIQDKVVKVTVGYIVIIADDSSKKHCIRLAGIDASEKDQPYGEASTHGLVKLLSGKPVTIEYKKHNRYKRILGKVLVYPPGEVFCMCFVCL